MGRTTVEFKVLEKPTGPDLFLDFRGVKIGRYYVNGEDALAGGQKLFGGHHVTLPTSLLKVGEVNQVQMLFLNKYRTDSEGLHSFTDKEDDSQYIYTQFEPACAHYVFPCFDQPDLKATWSFSAMTNGDWTVISNEAEIQNAERAQSLKQAVDEAKSLFNANEVVFNEAKASIFNTSFKISSYLYAFAAGAFGFYERQTEGMPLMRIYARKSLLGDVKHEDMFTAT